MQRGKGENKKSDGIRNALSRRTFLKMSGGIGLAGLALLGISYLVRVETTATPAPALDISPTNTAAGNRASLSKALTNSTANVTFPAGDYPIDNSGSDIVISNFGGQLAMEPGARFVFTDSTMKGLLFEKGTGARIEGLTTTFEILPPARVGSNECIQFVATVDTVVRDVNLFGSAAAGVLFDRCIRPSVDGAVIKNTMADGLHFANCHEARANNILTENTGDDGLAFLNYAERLDYSGGLATNITVKNSGTRGITVLGQRDVTVENFLVDASYASGVRVAHETYWNTRVPSDVRFAHGTITNAGKGPLGTGSVTANRFGIDFVNPSSAEFSDIEVISPADQGISGQASNGTVTLNGIRSVASPDRGFHLSARDLVLDDLTAQDCEGVGMYVVDCGTVRYGRLESINNSKAHATHQAFNFENNTLIDGGELHVIDDQRVATCYALLTHGAQAGDLGTIHTSIANGELVIDNQSGLSLTRPKWRWWR